ncbi:MAG: S8 family serine peptidase [Chloroflexota bacterium]|nr:S8 family serine peptidase [Chloroflexota bacterium]
MAGSAGFTWNLVPFRRRVRLAPVVALAVAFALGGVGLPAHDARPTSLVSVIVRETAGSGTGPEELVERLGGRVERHIEIIEAFVAIVPPNRLAALRTAPGVLSVTPDSQVQLMGAIGDGLGFDDPSEMGTMYTVAKAIDAHALWDGGITGRGIDIAVIDSGVVEVPELAGRVVYGPDLSFESQAPNLAHLDTYGHGTHMAGIIAGRDASAVGGRYRDTKYFMGVAPDSRIVSIKVAGSSGATDVSQVIAAIDWVVQHRSDNGMNIRVLNLSFGTDGTQSYLLDPLAYAAEVAWRRGIVVVVAAGNSGFGSTALNNPAFDPFVLAIGATDMRDTTDEADDTVATFSSRGDASRRPDLVAPGTRIVSLRDPGSELDIAYPAARIGNRFFRGSGTSQAAAVVSGSAALLLQQRPGLTPDQVKRLLTSTASAIPAADPLAAGAGMLDIRAASRAPTPIFAQTFPLAGGTGSLELARGSVHVSDGVAELRGEYDILGGTWDGMKWAPASVSGNTWSGGTWNGNTWSGNTWSGNTWSGHTWSGTTWGD